MKDMKDIKVIINKIKKEEVEYAGTINFASNGIVSTDIEMLVKAFNYGFMVGVECTKEDVINILSG